MSKKNLTEKEVSHLAKLAQLDLTAAEIKKYQEQLSETLEYVKNLAEMGEGAVNLDDIQDKSGVFFDDRISKERILTPDQALANAKNIKNQYFATERIG